MLPLALVVEQPWTLAMPSLGAWGALLGLALASTALAYILYFKLLEDTGAANILLVTFLIPVTSILLGVGLLNEVLLAKHFFGMAIIGLGFAAIDGRPYAALRRRTG
jgi:drug/metabolite transporter (DMT)-like permease